MKIILSPSKTQQKAVEYLNENVSVLYKNKTLKLFEMFKHLSKEDIQAIFKIKGNLLEETFDLYNSFSKNKKGIKAIDCYKGIVYEQIKVTEYNNSQINYLNSHLRLLSAMYGILEPNSIIWPYRLDMTKKIKDINLYHYWQESVDEYFKDEDVIINLASKEFSKMIKINKEKLININFYEEQADKKLKVISYNAKKARGTMTNLIIKNQLKNLELIKDYNVDGYQYSPKISDKNNFCFIKKFH